MRLSARGKKSVTLEVSFWWDQKDKAIHLVGKDAETKTFSVAIRDDPSKPSGQPYLFRELSKCLRTMGAPAPDESC